jgi:hypothetical protein
LYAEPGAVHQAECRFAAKKVHDPRGECRLRGVRGAGKRPGKLGRSNIAVQLPTRSCARFWQAMKDFFVEVCLADKK